LVLPQELRATIATIGLAVVVEVQANRLLALLPAICPCNGVLEVVLIRTVVTKERVVPCDNEKP
jgi:energy-converting hydrogenase Eha subunit E